MGLIKDMGAKPPLREWPLRNADTYEVVAFFQHAECPDVVRWNNRYFHYSERCDQYIETTITDVVSIDFKARAEDFKK